MMIENERIFTITYIVDLSNVSVCINCMTDNITVKNVRCMKHRQNVYRINECCEKLNPIAELAVVRFPCVNAPIDLT